MSTPSTDRAALTQVIRALKDAGWAPVKVDNREEEVATTTETAMLDAIFEVDEAFAYFREVAGGPGGNLGYILAVLGNEPFEVVADYTLNLDPTVATVTGAWD